MLRLLITLALILGTTIGPYYLGVWTKKIGNKNEDFRITMGHAPNYIVGLLALMILIVGVVFIGLFYQLAGELI
jgi:hypothetical protein